MIIVDDFEQNTPRWTAERLGNPGASGMSRVITSKGVRSDSREKYAEELAFEIVRRRQADTYNGWKMQQGHVNEGLSRDLYAFNHRCDLIQVALCYKDKQKKFHISPDGLRPDVKIGFETKDHTTAPHLQKEQYRKPVPSGHWIQCQTSLLCSEYNAWDYQTYCIGLDPFEKRIYPDDKFLVKLEAAIDDFCLEVAVNVMDIKSTQR